MYASIACGKHTYNVRKGYIIIHSKIRQRTDLNTFSIRHERVSIRL